MNLTASSGEINAELARWEMAAARRRLIPFCQRIDARVADKYGAKHLRRIAVELEKVERGEITRLFITTPPRHWKSSLVTEKFPLWYLARHPSESIGLFSHGEKLPTQFSLNVRGNIELNPRFQELFPAVRMKEGQNNKSDWSIEGAFRSSLRAIGVGGSPTGSGFDLLVLDDVVKDAQEAYSPGTLDKIWTWYQETLRDRLNPGGRIVLVMSRWHENDLAGRLMRESKAGTGEHWHELRLPAIAEAGDELGRSVGEALWPEVWPLAELERTKLAQGGRAFAARFQGSPRALQGNMLNSMLLKMVDAEDAPTSFTKLVRRWDLAFSDTKAADWSAGVKMGKTKDGKIWILHIKRVQGKWPQTEKIIRELAPQDGQQCHVAIECNGTQLGYADSMKADERMRGFVVVGDKPEGSKETRAALWGCRLEDGIIHCVRGAWNAELLEEMDFFPNGKNDDAIDGVSGGWKLLLESTGCIDVNRLPALPTGMNRLAVNTNILGDDDF